MTADSLTYYTQPGPVTDPGVYRVEVHRFLVVEQRLLVAPEVTEHAPQVPREHPLDPPVPDLAGNLKRLLVVADGRPHPPQVVVGQAQVAQNGRLGRFKKGAFHLAMQAGVPIVPVVFRNVLDAMPKDATVVRPATIEVVVLPPIDTSAWSVETIDEHVAAVEAAYRKALGQDRSASQPASLTVVKK